MNNQDDNIQTNNAPVQIEKLSFVDKYSINPLLFALLSLFGIFILYQGGGAILTFLVLGISYAKADFVDELRLLMVIAEIGFILIPTLFLTNLFTKKLSNVFCFRVPNMRESIFALIAMFALQRVFEAYMFFQKLIPLPEVIRQILEPIRESFEIATKLLVQANTPLELMFVIFVVAIVPSIVEELLFRGLIQRVFEKIMSPLVSAILAGTIFGLYHLNPFEMIPLIGIGVFLGMLRYRSGTLVLPIVMHFINNFMAVLASYYGLNEENLLSKPESNVSIETMLFLFIAFLGLFFISFVAYLRTTQDISRSFYKNS